MIKKMVTVAMAIVMVGATSLSGVTLLSVSVQAAPKKTKGYTDNGKWYYKYYKNTNSVGIRMVYKKVKKDGKTINIPNTVKINKKAYKVTRLLSDQFYSGNINQIDEDTYEDMIEDKYFKKLIIPSNIQIIDEDAFTYGEKLREVQFALNGSLKTIKNGAFSCCDIRNITIPASVTKIEEDAFLENTITKITFNRTSKFNMCCSAFDENPIGILYHDYDYSPEQCTLYVANYDMYKWMNDGSFFETDVKVKSAKTRLMIDSKKYVDINVGHNGGEFDLIKYVKWDKNYDFKGAEIGYLDYIYNDDSPKYRTLKVGTKVGSKAYPIMKVNKLLLEEKVYKIKTDGFEMINIAGRKNYFDAGKSIYTVGMNDTMKFLNFPTGSAFLRQGYHINAFGVGGKIFKPGDTAKGLTNKQNVTLNAELVYEPNKYQIKYDLNGGNGLVDSTACVFGSEAKITSTVPTKYGYEFVGWSTDSDGQVEYKASDSVKNLSSKDGDSVTLYAIWKRINKQVVLSITPDELSDGEEAEEYLVAYSVNGEKVYDRSLPVAGDETIEIIISDLYLGDVVEVTASGLLTDEDENQIESDIVKTRIVVN